MVYFPRKNKKMNVVAITKPKKTIQKKKAPRLSFAKKVNAIIASNVENKITATQTKTQNLCKYEITGCNWFLWQNFDTTALGGSGLFEISRGANVNQRIGNVIKLKRWVIKGIITPSALGYAFSENFFLQQSFQGYITVYFGKKKDGTQVSAQLYNLLQNGNTAETPEGKFTQMFNADNKDVYKIYYKRRFKMSPAYMGNSSTNVSPNNDFSLTKTFGFDVCKYICKNHKLVYNDDNNVPQSNTLNDLALWMTWTPAVGNMELAVNKSSFYNIVAQSYAEYEDA